MDLDPFSHGVPRTISVMCDNALMSGFALDQRRIDGHIVREVCRDFDLRSIEGKLQPAPSPLVLVESAAPAPVSRESTEPAADGTTGQKKQATGTPRRFSLLGLR
jgi:hypothetical protein